MEHETTEVSHQAQVQEDQRLLLTERIAAARQVLDTLERDLARAVPPPGSNPITRQGPHPKGSAVLTALTNADNSAAGQDVDRQGGRRSRRSGISCG
ncbi:hypothetical protein [Streptomyces sp. NPDC017958]|uniref:hypothetical protein n=1 Tax=Streptomyces sp. NPDC017958 TaxID=3365021 RepID=UPI00379F0556